MYEIVRKLKSPPEQYEAELVSEGVLDAGEAKSYKESVVTDLDAVLAKADSYVVADPPSASAIAVHADLAVRDGWRAMTWPTTAEVSPATGVAADVLKQVGRASVAAPEDFAVHPSLEKRHIAKRLSTIESGKDIDYATAEALAWGSLMLEGNNVRISGQVRTESLTKSDRHRTAAVARSRTVTPFSSTSARKPAMSR